MQEPLFDTIERLDPYTPRPDFDCGNPDLNEFFHKDSAAAGSELMAVTYVARHIKTGEVIAYYCISNDSIRKDSIPRERFKRVAKEIPFQKRYKTLPAVKIGRLATSKAFQSNGVGQDILDALKNSFTEKNKTGCRYIIVDAANGPRTLQFYERNGFEYLLTTDINASTRLMFFDLRLFRP